MYGWLLSTIKIISIVKSYGLLDFPAQPNFAKEQLVELLKLGDFPYLLKQSTVNCWVKEI